MATLAVLAAFLLSPVAGKAVSHEGGFEVVHALAMDAEGRVLYLGLHFGLFRSQDGGRSWKRVRLSTRHPHLDLLAIVADPNDPRTVYVATHEVGILKSADGGATWREANRGLGDLDVHGLAIDPTDPRTLYAAVRGKGEGIYRTTDGASTWRRVADGPGGDVKVLAWAPMPPGGSALYVGTVQGLRRSADPFREWEPVGGLPAHRAVNGLAAAPRDPRALYAAMPDGLFYSTDAGTTWTTLGRGLANLTAVVVNPRQPAELYAVSSDAALFRSSDGGATWEPLRKEPPSQPSELRSRL